KKGTSPCGVFKKSAIMFFGYIDNFLSPKRRTCEATHGCNRKVPGGVRSARNHRHHPQCTKSNRVVNSLSCWKAAEFECSPASADSTSRLRVSLSPR